MTSSIATRTPAPRMRAGPAVKAIGWLTALWCLGFAGINIVYEITDHFADGPFADYAAAFTVMNWLVACLKVAGAAIALLSITSRPRARLKKMLLAMSLWGAFATLTVYTLGSVAEAIGMVLGLTGTADEIDLAGLVYVLSFALGATGYGILAASYSKRHHMRRRLAVLGALVAPLVLGLVLVGAPALLSALDVMPA